MNDYVARDDVKLLKHHANLVAASGISAEVASARGYRSITTKAELASRGFSRNQQRVPALLIPIWNVSGSIGLYQARPDEPRIIKGKALKYETPRGARMVLDVPPSAREWLRDPKIPLFVTEGVRKADSAVSRGLCCIDVLGVWNWRGTNEAGGKAALPEWESVALNDRHVFIVFDSDVVQKKEVRAALERLKSFLECRGAIVQVLYLPQEPGGAKVGLDDYFANGHTVNDLLSMTAPQSEEHAQTESAESGPYVVEDGQICFLKDTREGPVVVPLCNFQARVSEEIILDDGVDTSRAFEIQGSLATGESLPSARVPVDQFGAMGWVTQRWGIEAVISAGFGARDRLREAIQRFSRNARRRHVFTHTGWRTIDGRWIYLTASGAVGVEGFEVDLGAELARLRLPRIPNDPVQAIKSSLSLLELAPLAITVPLWASVFRAPLAAALPVDMSVWILGITGSLKSTLAALFQSHWGQFERTSLPGAWSSTANALERRAFILKDALFVVDDFAPQTLDQRELAAKASRLLRAQGNIAGRGRLRSDLTERPAFPPRGLIVSTGEQRPSGQSILARTFIVDLHRDDVDLDRLTEAQRQAHHLAHALAAYITWLAPQMATMSAKLSETFHRTRIRAAEEGVHLRIPEALAHLWIGLDCGLAFAQEIGACEAGRAAELRAHGWEALVERAKAQSRSIEEERPSRRFIEILGTLLAQHRVLLLPKEHSGGGVRPDIPLIGWHDAEFLYLIPDAAFQVVNRFAREAGEAFPIGQSRLRQDLVREGIAEPASGRNTALTRAGGTTRRVLRLRRAAVEAVLGEEAGALLPVVTAVTGYEE